MQIVLNVCVMNVARVTKRRHVKYFEFVDAYRKARVTLEFDFVHEASGKPAAQARLFAVVSVRSFAAPCLVCNMGNKRTLLSII